MIDPLEKLLGSGALRRGPVFVTRAPGRLDVMGGIADYSGSLVLELPLREATHALLQPGRGRTLRFESAEEDAPFETSLDDLLRMTYGEARAFFRSDPSRLWAGYAAGAFLVLARERNAVFSEGARILVRSEIPRGRGVASSAALEVAVMMAIDAAYGLAVEPREIALLCQRVENEIVGAPCGVMDQMTCVLGEENRLLALLCQPAKVEGALAVPHRLSFWGIDSGIAHAVTGNDYASVRIGAFMGYRWLQELAGSDFGGYLANLSASELEAKYRERLPETISGAEFLARFGGHADAATHVDPGATYPVRHAAAHPVLEHRRIRSFAQLLKLGAAQAPALGRLMFESHESYSACGLGSTGTDRLVELAREAGPARGIFGAKITGGGSGGTVAILARRDADEEVRAIARRYAEETGREPRLFSGSSPGARAFGCRRFDI